jgi:hypothetical protein
MFIWRPFSNTSGPILILLPPGNEKHKDYQNTLLLTSYTMYSPDKAKLGLGCFQSIRCIPGLNKTVPNRRLIKCLDPGLQGISLESGVCEGGVRSKPSPLPP